MITAGSQQGGKYMLTGALQRAGGWSRITLRIVDVQTGAVLHSAKGQEEGTGMDGVVPAMRMAFDGRLPLRPALTVARPAGTGERRAELRHRASGASA